MSDDAMTPPRHDPLHPAHDAGVRRPTPTAIVAQWPPGTFLENLAPHADGSSWWVTSPSDCAVYLVDATGTVREAARFGAQTPTGIVSHPRVGTLVAVGTECQADWRLVRMTDERADPLCELPEVLGANGMTWARDKLLVADSGRSVVVAVDVNAGSVETWLRHPLLSPVDRAAALPGINGLAYHAGWVFMTSSDRGLILKAPADSHDPATDLETVATRLVGDDLTVAPDGRIFVATHTYHSVLCLYPDGRREDIATHDDGVAGPTAIAIGGEPSPAVYACTTGGLLSPPGNEVEPARLIRIEALAP